jgi:hypothetical protein
MIIDYPTGSYNTVLPQNPSDSASVVYTISDSVPPRSSLNFIQLPTGIRNMQRDTRTLPSSIRRSNLGNLATITKDNKPEQIGVGNQLFYATQVIDFGDLVEISVTDINSDLETQHDQHYINPVSVGLDESDMGDVIANALVSQQRILEELEILQKRKWDLQVNIVSQQRIMNEAAKVLSGLDAIISNDPDNQEMVSIKTSVTARQQAAAEAIEIYTAELNTIPADVRSKHDQLRALAVLIN